MDAKSYFGGSVRLVPVAGGSIEVEVVGNGPAVILVHGWTLDRRMWERQVPELARRFRVITYDRRGSGGSDAPYDLLRESEDLIAIADALGLDRFALVGMSQGARVALAFTALCSHRLWALAVQGAPMSDVAMIAGSDEEIPIAQMRELSRNGDLNGLRGLWLKHHLLQTKDSAARGLIEAMIGEYRWQDLSEEATELRVVQADLSSIDVPTLIITGAQETLWRKRVAEVLEAGIPNSQHVIIEGAGHLCNLCEAASYNAALIEFLAGAATSRGDLDSIADCQG